jgi:hypothetical protein
VSKFKLKLEQQKKPKSWMKKSNAVVHHLFTSMVIQQVLSSKLQKIIIPIDEKKN